MNQASLLSTSGSWTLITIPVSHYCEKARWALDRIQVSYIEQPHLISFHRKATQTVGGSTVPVLITPQDCLTDSTDILHYLDQFAPETAKLYPSDLETLKRVEVLESLFNQMLGPATRCWGYFYLLEQTEILEQQLCRDIPQKEKTVYPKVLPKIRDIIRQNLNISENSMVSALKTIHGIFDRVQEQLSDGRPYLFGETLTAADLTFGALATPIILPPEHPTNLTIGPHLPQAMVNEILACRQTAAGELVLRLYRVNRHEKI